jgi:uncharacterized protein involved in cysteine biosynthesis
MKFDPTLITGICLWTLALYIGFSSLKDWIIDFLNRCFNWVTKFVYSATEEFEKNLDDRELQNSFYASLFSIFPFFILGGLCHWLVELSLGRSWSISFSILTCMVCAIFQLGKLDSQNNL